MRIELDNGEEINIYSYRPNNKSDAVFIGDISLEIEEEVKCFLPASWDKEGEMLGNMSSIGDIPKQRLEEIVEYFEEIKSLKDKIFPEGENLSDEDIEEELIITGIDADNIKSFLKENNINWKTIYLVLNEIDKWEVHEKEPIYIETKPLFDEENNYYSPRRWKEEGGRITLPVKLYPEIDFGFMDWTDIKLKLEYDE